MKRIFPFLVFAVAVIAWGTLETGENTPVFRTGILVVIAGLTVWKAVDFWKRFRDEDDDPEEGSHRRDGVA